MVRRRQSRLPPDRGEGVEQGHRHAGARRRDDVLVHLAVEEHELRIQIHHGRDEAAHGRGRCGALSAAAQVHEPVADAGVGIRFEEAVIAARFQCKEAETMMVDELASVVRTGIDDFVVGGGEATPELQARVENAAPTSRCDQNGTHHALPIPCCGSHQVNHWCCMIFRVAAVLSKPGSQVVGPMPRTWNRRPASPSA